MSVVGRAALPLVVVAAWSLVGVGGAGAAKRVFGEPPFFRLSRLEAVSLPQGFATRFSVTASSVSSDDMPKYTWYLRLATPAKLGASACADSVFPGGQRVSATEYLWANSGSSFVWYHGVKGSYPADPAYGCDQAKIGVDGYPGTVSVVAENEYQHCDVSFAGVSAGAQPRFGAVARCGLGGYTLGASTLPVPAPLLSLYHTLAAELAALLERTREGKVGGGKALAAALAPLLGDQQTAFGKLAPPVWGCSFGGFFDDVLLGEAALRGEGLAPAQTGQLTAPSLPVADTELRALARAVATCQRSPTNADGPPAAVVAALARLSAEAAALHGAQGTGRGATLLKARLSAIGDALDTIVSKSFPTVFGIPFIDLVDRTLAEDTAATVAQRAADLQETSQTVAALQAILAPTQTTGRALHAQQARVVKRENSNS